MVGSRTRRIDHLEGAIGSGLLVGTGPTLSKGTNLYLYPSYNTQDFIGGPLGLLLGYIYVGAQS